MEHKNSQPHIKVAYLNKPIVASSETDDGAQNAANLFAGDSRDAKSFNDNYEKTLRSKGISRLVAADIKPNDYNIPGLGTSRQFVKAVFKTERGDVLQPERVGDNYVVAMVTEVNEEGAASISQSKSNHRADFAKREKGCANKTKAWKNKHSGNCCIYSWPTSSICG